MCSIRTSGQNQHFCGATLISPQLAITSAFCVAAATGVPNPLLWCGGGSSDQLTAEAEPLQAVATTVHECYRRQTYLNGVAVLQLNASARSAQHGVPSLLRPGELDPPPTGYPFTAVGWGLTK